jgi:hypothetical protein
VGEEYPLGSEAAEPTARPREEYGKAEPEAGQHFSTGLGQQLHDMRRYAQPLDALDAYINQHYSGALPNERQWLREHPEHLQNVALVHAAGMAALQHGVPRHSPQFLQAIEQLLAQHHAAMQAPPMQHAPAPPPKPPPMNIDLEKTESHDDDHDSEPDSDHMAAHHYAAPVSHDAGSHSIEPELSPSQVRLSKAEREHAEAAGVSVEEYAKNKLKMEKMKKAKLIE